MNLNQLGKNWKKECLDIKERPKLYLLKILALIFFAFSYYLIFSPFLSSIESYVGKWGIIGMLYLPVNLILKKIAPQTISLFCGGEIICQIDNIKDLVKINCFYIIVLSCSFLFVSFLKQIKDSLEFLFYGSRTINPK